MKASFFRSFEMISHFRKMEIQGKLITSLLFGVIPVVALHLHSENFHKKKNSFFRVFPPHAILTTKILDIGPKDSYFIGNTSNTVYINNYKNPFDLLIVRMNLKDTHSIHLSLAGYRQFDPSQILITVDSPNVFAIDKLSSAILRCTVDSPKSFISLNEFRFSSTEAAAVSGESVILRAYQGNIQNNILAKLNYHRLPHLDSANILEKQIDGFFCTDGSLQIDHQTNRLIYMYYYRNQFIYLDTNLKVIYRAKTIDTNTRSKIQVRTIRDQSMLAAPPLLVNKLACVSGKWILICSALFANNENKNIFDNNSVIDIYESKDGRYRFSFYLPKINNNKISSFILQGNQLFAIQGSSLVRYDLDL
jgi:hypothetical protein